MDISLVLQPRAAPSGRLRLWVGAFDLAAVPSLAWRLDGKAVTALPVRALGPAHPYSARSSTGVYEIVGGPAHPVTAGQSCRVDVRTTSGPLARTSLNTRSLPGSLPTAPGSSFRVLITSCFHFAEDKRGRTGALIERLPPAHRPDLTLLLGDQVYLDLPTLQDFPGRASWLARKFEQDYRANWLGDRGRGFPQLLSVAPSVSTADDHEYWNNYPHASPFIGNTWTAAGRQRWESAARSLFSAYQNPDPLPIGSPVEIGVRPLSFFLLDNRSDRQANRSRSMEPGSPAALKAWVDRTIADGHTGIVVCGQSLLDPRVGALAGAVGDRVLANYGDYPGLVRELVRLSDAGRPVVLLTGDVHWGRVTNIRSADDRLRFVEVICSPSALVTTVGQDQMRRLGSAIGSLFGRRDPWPRHSKPKPSPEYFAREVLGKRYRTRVVDTKRGNQVATLTFKVTAGHVRMSVTYWPVRAGPLRPDHAATVSLGPYS